MGARESLNNGTNGAKKGNSSRHFFFFFFAPLDLPLPPLSAPGSLRMISVQPIDLLCIYVSEITTCIINIWGCTEILLPLVHISGCPTEAKKAIILNAVSITACLVHKVVKFLVSVTHDIMT